MKNQFAFKTVTFLAGLLATEMALAKLPNFSSANGTVLIAAPTALNGPTNQGAWFVNPSTKSFSLSLPDLDSDSVYEGWLVDDCTGKKVSTGIFKATGAFDSDSAGRYAGPLSLNFPPVPGSDFVTLGHNIVDGGHHIVITVEPYPDNDPNPSSVAILRASIPADTAVGSELSFQNISK